MRTQIARMLTPLWLCLWLCLGSTPSLAQDDLKRVVDRENLQKVIAVVEALNVANRIATIRILGRNEVVVMEVGPQVRNLDQVRVGDRLVVEFLEALAVDLKKGGGLEESGGMALGAARAKPGEKPGASVSGTLVLVATVMGIDPDEPSVTLMGPQGNVAELLVRDPAKLEQVDVGDQVVIQYERALIVDVRPVKGGQMTGQ